MSLFRLSLAVLITAASLATPAMASNVRRGPTASSAHRSSKKLVTRRSSRHIIKGQQSIDFDRVTQIQQALIREHYLSGDPTGSWDSSTVAAMQKYQSDQGWQTKLTPDSRAIKKLGLGPDYSTAINAKDSSFADPPPISTIPDSQTAGFSAAAGVNQ